MYGDMNLMLSISLLNNSFISTKKMSIEKQKYKNNKCTYFSTLSITKTISSWLGGLKNNNAQTQMQVWCMNIQKGEEGEGREKCLHRQSKFYLQLQHWHSLEAVSSIQSVPVTQSKLLKLTSIKKKLMQSTQ